MDSRDKYKWLRQYAKPCMKKGQRLEELPNIKTIEEFLAGDYSREKVRDYFMTVHNLRTLKERNYVHLLIPYNALRIGGQGFCYSVHEPFFQDLPVPFCNISFDNNKIQKARDSGIINNMKINDILLVHFLEIVDFCTKKELNKYDYLYGTQLILK